MKKEKVIQQLQGGWLLRDLEAPNFDENLRQERAIMVVGGSFLSMEVHLAWDLREGDEWIDGFFQSGISRIWIERSNTLIARALIGVVTNEDYEIEIEPPGTERRYSVRFQEKNELILNMDDGPRLAFKRLQNSGARRSSSSPDYDPSPR